MTSLIANPKLGQRDTPHGWQTPVRDGDVHAEPVDEQTSREEVRTAPKSGVDLWDLARLDDYRRRAIAFDRSRRSEEAVDGILAGSFPASDPPPWTLGDSRGPGGASASPAERTGIVTVSGARSGGLGWRGGVSSLVGAAMVALLFVLGIVVVGAVVALAVRLLYEVLAGAVGRLPF